MTRIWEMPIEPPHPPARVRATQVRLDDEKVPGGARQVIELAERNGWTVTAEYAHGNTLDARGKTGPVKESLVLRIKQDGRYIVAFWLDGVYGSAYSMCRGELIPIEGGSKLWVLDARRLPAADLKDRIKADAA